MRNSKKWAMFSLGRKLVFTLALFVLVFAAASFVKADYEFSGWLWGGTEDASIGGTTGDSRSSCKNTPFAPPDDPKCIDGNETGVYWISTNSKNCDLDGDGVYEGINENSPDDPPAGCPTLGSAVKYGLTFKQYGSPPVFLYTVEGYAWSSSLGWIDFEPGKHCVKSPAAPGPGQYQAADCDDPEGVAMSPACQALLAGNTYVFTNVSKARIVEIAKATVPPGNSGGWNGWIKLSGNIASGGQYQVKIDKTTGNASGYAWSEELGWIDFSRAKINAICTMVDPTGTILAYDNNCRELYVELSGNAPGETITFSENSDNLVLSSATPCPSAASSFTGQSTASCTVSSTNGGCSVYIAAKDFSGATYTDNTVNATSSCGTKTIPVTVNHKTNCAISCPESIEISPDASADPVEITPSCTGADCNGNNAHINSCQGGTTAISITGPFANKSCRVKANDGATYTDQTTAIIGSQECGPCQTKINIKRLWIETNP